MFHSLRVKALGNVFRDGIRENCNIFLQRSHVQKSITHSVCFNVYVSMCGWIIFDVSQLTISCSKSTIETLENDMYVQGRRH